MKSVQAFSFVLLTFLVLWIGAFLYFAKVFGANAAGALSLFPAVPLFFAVRMRCRWQSVHTKDIVYLAVVLALSLGGATMIAGSWYEDGLHERPGTWTLFTP